MFHCELATRRGAPWTSYKVILISFTTLFPLLSRLKLLPFFIFFLFGAKKQSTKETWKAWWSNVSQNIVSKSSFFNGRSQPRFNRLSLASSSREASPLRSLSIAPRGPSIVHRSSIFPFPSHPSIVSMGLLFRFPFPFDEWRHAFSFPQHLLKF